MYATLVSRDVDCCLIPESPFYLEVLGGLFEFMEKRLKEQGLMVIVIAEGAGQELVSESIRTMDQQYASENKLLQDVGLWISQKELYNIMKIEPSFESKGIKLIYIIKAGGMQVIEGQNKVVITGRMWARLLSSTNQPSFLHPKHGIDHDEKEEPKTHLEEGENHTGD